jgi:hypothetical protein
MFKGKSAPEPIRRALAKAGIKTRGPVPIKTELEKTVEAARKLKIEPLTSDIFPPKTPTQKAIQVGTERMPIIGTGGVRVKEQEARIEAIRGVLREYGATETAQASDDVMKDLLKKRGADIQKYVKQKTDVIKSVSKRTIPDPKKSTKIRIDALITNLKEKGIKFNAYHNKKRNTIELSKIIIPEMKRDFGKGSKVMKEFLEIADKSGSTVTLTPSKDFGGSVTRLKKFYKKFDFVENRGKNKNYEISDSMYRKPQGETSISMLKNPVPTGKTASAINGEISRLKTLDNKDVKPIINALENSRTSFTEKSLAQVEDNRKLLGETLEDVGFAKVKSQADKVNKKIYKAVNEDMGEFIKTTGKRRDYDNWKIANQRLASNIRELDISALKAAIKNGNSTPEEVRKLLFAKRPSDINRLYKSLSPQGKARARVAMWQEAMVKAGGIDELSTAKFQTALKNMEKSTGVFFKGEDKRVLDGLVKALKSTRRAEIASVSPPTGVQNYQNIAALGLGGGAVAGGAKFVVPALTIGAAARAYESKAVRNLLIKIAKGKGNEQKYISQLVNILRTKHQLQRKDSAADKRKALELINRKT